MRSEFVVMLVGCAAVTYLTRIAGFYAGGRDLSPRTQGILAYVPVGAFSSIVALGVSDSSGQLDSRIPALLVSGLLAYWSKPLWLCLAIGLAVYAAIEVAV
jgi:branched-subunit amino acid transport protein